jgi:anaerobic selenocysteine-containing dehydrogenase
MAIYSLNALLGSIGTKGGLFTPKKTSWLLEPIVQDQLAYKSLRASPLLHPLLEKSRKYWVGQPIKLDHPVELFFIIHANPLRYMAASQSEQFIAFLKKTPCVVSFSSYLDETSRYADLLLPDHTILEKWNLFTSSAEKGSWIGLQQPVVPPFRNTKDSADVFIALSRGLGGTVAQFSPEETWAKVVKKYIEKLSLPGKASLSEGRNASWDRLNQEGILWQTKVEEQSIPETPSGKFEFFSQRLKERLTKEPDGTKLGVTSSVSAAFLPHYEPPKFSGSAMEYPFYLYLYRNIMDSDGKAANSPWLLENYGYMLSEQWNVWVEVNPVTALQLNIQDGETIGLESPYGALLTKVHLYEGVPPNVVGMPLGIGGPGYGRWGSKRGEALTKIWGTLKDEISGQLAYSVTRVKIQRRKV